MESIERSPARWWVPFLAIWTGQLGPFAGTPVDRWDRRRVMIVADGFPVPAIVNIEQGGRGALDAEPAPTVAEVPAAAD